MKGDFLLLFLIIFPIAGATVTGLIGRRNDVLRDNFSDAVTVVELLALVTVCTTFFTHGDRSFGWDGICGLGIYFRLDGFRLIFGTLAAFTWTMTSLFSHEYMRAMDKLNRYYFFNLLTFGATMGVFLADDLFTAFIFFEIMGLTSYINIIHDESHLALKAGATYLTVAVIGGMVMLMGLFMLQHQAGTLFIGRLAEACAAADNKGSLYLAGTLILIGYGTKAGMFPLHIWLPDTYTAAPAPATAILSGILSKTGIFGILVVCSNMFFHDKNWGLVMVAFSIATMVVASVLAVFSTNLKRTLAYSSMSQIGFILMGCAMQGVLGEHNALAVRGTVLHMVNHSLIKLVLFMAAGVVFVNCKSYHLNKIRGFGRRKPMLTFCFLMGMLGIIGMPLWNGYISKTLLHESIVEYIGICSAHTEARFFLAVEAVFIFCSGLTVAYMIKLFVAVFLEKSSNEPYTRDTGYMSRRTALALIIPSVIMPVLGVLPNLLMDGLASIGQGFLNGEEPAHMTHYFSWANLEGTVLSLFIGVIMYLIVVRIVMMKTENGCRVYINDLPSWLSLERLFYRPVFLILIWMSAFTSRLVDAAPNTAVYIARWILRPVHPRKYFTHKEQRKEKQSRVTINRSLSFSLLLFGLGLCIVLFYLIATAWMRIK